MDPVNKIESAARLAVTTLFFIWNLYYGALVQTPYPKALVSLYVHPLWRVLLILFLAASIAWCPRVGMMVGLALFFYFMDMPHFIHPWD